MKKAIKLIVAGGIIVLLLQSCSQLYTLNRAIKYEYELNRQSQTDTKTHLKVSNEE